MTGGKNCNSDLEDEDDDESQESSSSSIITPKEALSFLDKVHLFATYNENNDLQHRIDDLITIIEDISIRAKNKHIDHRLSSLISFLVNVYYDTKFRELKVFFF